MNRWFHGSMLYATYREVLKLLFRWIDEAFPIIYLFIYRKFRIILESASRRMAEECAASRVPKTIFMDYRRFQIYIKYSIIIIIIPVIFVLAWVGELYHVRRRVIDSFIRLAIYEHVSVFTRISFFIRHYI